MIQSPPDRLVRGVLGQPEHARGFLRENAPAKLAAALDWQTLRRCPSDFIDRRLGERRADLLYSVEWRDGRGGPVYFLIEHQSEPPTVELMALRVLRYEIRLWEDWHGQHPAQRQLPTIVPIVLYHGATRWKTPRRFQALLETRFGVRAEIKPYLVHHEYMLHDLSTISDAELRRRPLSAAAKLVALCLKHARAGGNFLQRLAGWMDLAQEMLAAPDGDRALAQVLWYISEVVEPLTREQLEEFVERKLGPQVKEVLMTIGQQLREEGRKEGAERWLLRLLRQRFGVEVDSRIERRLAAASLKQLDAWMDRVLSARTLADVLGYAPDPRGASRSSRPRRRKPAHAAHVH